MVEEIRRCRRRRGLLQGRCHEESAEVQALVAAAVQRHGKLDAMVNNAGWTHRNRPALEVSEDEFDPLRGQREDIYLAAIHAVPACVPTGRQLHQHRLHGGLCAPSGPDLVQRLQGAVITTSKSLAAELGPDNIRVNCINPVFNPHHGLATEFAGGELTKSPGQFLATIPLGAFPPRSTWPTPRCYLASDEASFISGVCIEGGRRALRMTANSSRVWHCPTVGA